jgi:hypothetical protein
MNPVFPIPAMLFSDTLDTHIVHSAERKRHFGEVEKTFFQGNAWTLKVSLPSVKLK